MLFIFPTHAWSQTSAIPWSAFSGGFGIATSTNTVVQASTGEIVGAAEGMNTMIRSGFLVVKLPSSPHNAIDESGGPPTAYALHSNYPNPFNPGTHIPFDLPAATNVRFIVYDLLGQEVIRLADQELQPGYHQLIWAGRDARGRDVPAGIYIARLVTPSYTKSIKMLLLK